MRHAALSLALLSILAATPATAWGARSEGEVTCTAARCGVMWQRAHIWLKAHAVNRIAVSRDTLVSIAGRHDYPSLRTPLIFIERLPEGGGLTRILLHMECSYAEPGCAYNRRAAAADFVRFLTTGARSTPPGAASVRS